jgi:hypothetical protein
MNDPDPTQVASLEGLAECLRQLHIRADRPSFRELEDRTKHANGLLPGTSLKRVRLGRTTLNDVLRGFKFPRKAFLLTFVEALHVDLKADRRWEQAWDQLAIQYLDQAAEAEVEHLRRQLAEARAQADRADKEAEQLRQQLAEAEDLSRQQTSAAEEMATHLEIAQAQAREAHDRLTEATAAHIAELERIRADAQARIEEAQAAAVRAAEDRIAETEQQAREHAGRHRQAAQDVNQRAGRGITADQGALVSHDGLANRDISASRDAPEHQDASAVPDLEREIRVVPGVARYHQPRCVLIRFMGESDLDTMTIAEARQGGYDPCRACLPDHPLLSAV